MDVQEGSDAAIRANVVRSVFAAGGPMITVNAVYKLWFGHERNCGGDRHGGNGVTTYAKYPYPPSPIFVLGIYCYQDQRCVTCKEDNSRIRIFFSYLPLAFPRGDNTMWL